MGEHTASLMKNIWEVGVGGGDGGTYGLFNEEYLGSVGGGDGGTYGLFNEDYLGARTYEAYDLFNEDYMGMGVGMGVGMEGGGGQDHPSLMKVTSWEWGFWWEQKQTISLIKIIGGGGWGAGS